MSLEPPSAPNPPSMSTSSLPVGKLSTNEPGIPDPTDPPSDRTEGSEPKISDSDSTVTATSSVLLPETPNNGASSSTGSNSSPSILSNSTGAGEGGEKMGDVTEEDDVKLVINVGDGNGHESGEKDKNDHHHHHHGFIESAEQAVVDEIAEEVQEELDAITSPEHGMKSVVTSLSKKRKYLGWFLAFCVFYGFMYWVVFGSGLLDVLAPAIQALGEAPFWLSFPIYAVITIPTSNMFIPRSIFGVVAGFLYGTPLGWAVDTTVAVAGAMFINFVGIRWFRSRLDSALEGSPKLKAVDRAIEMRGFILISFLRLSIVTNYTGNNVIVALSSASTKAKFFGSLLGVIPYSFVYTVVGAALGNLENVIGAVSNPEGDAARVQEILLIVGAIVTIAIIVAVSVLAKRILEEGVEAAEVAMEEERRASDAAEEQAAAAAAAAAADEADVGHGSATGAGAGTSSSGVEAPAAPAVAAVSL